MSTERAGYMLLGKKSFVTHWLWIVIILTCTSYGTTQPTTASHQESWTSIFERTKNNVVQIFAYGTSYDWMNPYQHGDDFRCRGTGALVSEQGDIYTNFHVVESANVICIQHPLLWKEKFEVEFLGASPSCDLAHLRIKPEELKRLLGMLTIKRLDYLVFGDSDTMKQGNEIMVIGYPLGDETIKHSLGTISGQEYTTVGGECFSLDASAYPGNSGGPVVNNRGEIIGFLSAVAKHDNQAVERISYAIPVNRLKAIATELENGALMRPSWWGLRFAPTTSDTIAYLGCKNETGIYVALVAASSLAERAGIKEGDIITKVNNFNVDRFGYVIVPWTDYHISFADILARIKNGNRVEFTVWRKGKSVTCSVEKCPPSPSEVKNYYLPFENEPAYDVFGGMVFMEMTKNHIAQFLAAMYDLFPLLPLAEGTAYTQWLEQLKFVVDGDKETPHVIITNVFPETDLSKSSMFGPFDCVIRKVNTVSVHTIAELQEAIRKGASSGYVLIETLYGTKAALPIHKILAQEKELADKYGYQLSVLVEQLAQTPKTAGRPQKAPRP
jgi:S1-C subfamily serine protease